MLDEGYLLAPGALFHADRAPSSLMRINFATTQEAQFWATFARLRDEQSGAGAISRRAAPSEFAPWGQRPAQRRSVGILADVVEQRQLLHLRVGLQRGLVAGLLVLEVGHTLDHVEVFGAGAVGFELDRAF